MSFQKVVAEAAGDRRRFAKKIIVMPAYNAAATLEATVRDIPPNCVSEIILVDDASRDDTVAVARSLGLTVAQHSATKGYGANQKTCYRIALESGADAVVMIHPDYQYDGYLAQPAFELLESGACDIVLGNRIRSRRDALSSGMPPYKYVANRALTLLENLALGQNLGDFHSGFRAYVREVLETVPYEENSDDFVFDTEFLAQAVYFGFRIGDMAIPCRYFPEASSINFLRSVKYGCQTVGVMAQYLLARARIARPWRRRRRSNSDTAPGAP
jgi:glycosyltransferase involved in cell wall biosynthesis